MTALHTNTSECFFIYTIYDRRRRCSCYVRVFAQCLSRDSRITLWWAHWVVPESCRNSWATICQRACISWMWCERITTASNKHFATTLYGVESEEDNLKSMNAWKFSSYKYFVNVGSTLNTNILFYSLCEFLIRNYIKKKKTSTS